MKKPKAPPPPPPPIPVPTIDEAAASRDSNDRMLKRRGRKSSIFAGLLTKKVEAGGVPAATKKLTGES